jgi:sugar O-acyltransferase (sialic acid O-acetyltransferase NeuD family)
MNKTLGVLGAGDFGQQIAHMAISDKHYKNVVFFDDCIDEKTVNGYMVYGKSNDIEKAYEQKFFDELIIGIGYKHLEKRAFFYNKYSGKIPFATLIHSRSYVDSTVKIEEGCVIYPGAVIDMNCTIGPGSVINLSCVISHDCTIGDYCFLAPKVVLAGFADIGSKCFLGLGSIVIDRIKLSDSVQLGAGTLVTKDIKEKGLYIGQPARRLK